MSITREQQEQLTLIQTRLARLGVKDPTGQILALDNEVKYYRDKIQGLEEKLKEQAKPITCKECNKRHTLACALWFSSWNGRAYLCERGDDFSCSWAEPRIERLTKGHLDGLSAKITVIDELHETKNHEEDEHDT